MQRVYRRRPGIRVTALLQQWPSLADRRLIAMLTLFYIDPTGKINIPLCNIMDISDSRSRDANNNYKLYFYKTHSRWSIILPENSQNIGISLTTKPKNPLPPYSLRTVSEPHTASLTANPTTTTVSSYLTVTETYQPRTRISEEPHE